MKPALTLLTALLLAPLAALHAAEQPARPADVAVAQIRENPFPSATVVWHMAPGETEGNASTELKKEGLQGGAGLAGNMLTALKTNGPVKWTKLEGQDYAESLKRGGDGHVATLRDKAFFSLDSDFARALRPSGNAVTFAARVLVSEPGRREGSGPGIEGQSTIFFSDLIGLGVHPSGMAVAFLGERIPSGVTLRELPLTQVQHGVWLDLVLRVGGGKLDFFCNGSLQISVPVEGELHPPGSWPLYVGAFGWGKRQGGQTAFFDGNIDHVALWDRPLTDQQVAFLSGISRLGKPREKDGASLVIEAFHRFFYASVRKDVEASVRHERTMREFMNRDPYRPGYHLSAPIGWIYDPSGACFYNGQYHVFTYRNIYARLRYCSLDHYVSDDLIHWRQWPVAPWADGDRDVCGIWLSNHFIDDQGIPNIIYCSHGDVDKVGHEYGIRARSYDGLVSYTDKKVVMYPHHDGHTWSEDDTWYALTCRSVPGSNVRSVVLLTSSDLDYWTQKGVVFTPKKDELSNHHLAKIGYTEFPYLLKFGNKDVLMIGAAPCVYWVGHLDRQTGRFTPDHAEGLLVDYANPFPCFNPSAVDQKGPGGTARRIIMMMDSRASGVYNGIPWDGVHAMPRSLALDGNRLRQDPLPEFEALRGKHTSQKDILVTPDRSGYLQERGDMLEITAEFEPGDARVFGLKVRLSDDNKTYVRVFYDAVTGEYGLDGNIMEPFHRGIPGPVPRVGKGPSYIPKGQPVQIRVFLDRIMVETFVNGQTCTTLLKDRNLAHDRLDLFSEGGTALCTKLNVWNMNRAEPK